MLRDIGVGFTKDIVAIPSNGRESKMSQKQTEESLQQRVNELLRVNPLGYAVEVTKQQSVEDFSRLLLTAEKELTASQARVDRLKWELEKARA